MVVARRPRRTVSVAMECARTCKCKSRGGRILAPHRVAAGVAGGCH
ncbi:hypothetical protein ES332_D10G205400v1 [Gossypium tomentosum]|uniref:Uncharacterized protein n=1 Tax=Gossypium tomentosum TaxID=34277 RepID=A0A5D2J850_GOSTO|nr:hypothetical protein ES332_D10G205400v1 [Gossypium tomentosum]